MLEEYSKIQALVQKEARQIAEQVYKENATKYGVAKVPLHRHNGLDSPKVRIQDIDSMVGSSGSITMATDGQRYYIGLNVASGIGITPSSVRFNGIAIHRTGGTIDIRAVVVGDAFIGTSFYNQPGTSSSVVVGGPSHPVIQSSSYILIDSSTTQVIAVSGGGGGNVTVPIPTVRALVSEGHIVSVEYPSGTVVARATIPDLGDYGANEKPIQDGRLVVDVELETGWEIIGNWQLA